MQSDKQAFDSLQLEILGKLAPAIAHDINNLLSGILGYSQIIISDPSAGGLKSSAEEITKAGKRISGLVRLLQVFNQRQFFEELLDLNQIIRELEKYIMPIIGKNILFSIQTSPELWPIRADKSLIRQALLLWFSGLQQLLPQGGQVTLGTENFISAPDSDEAQAKCKQEVRIHAELAGDLTFNSSLSYSSDDVEVMNGSIQKVNQATISGAEIIHLCGGRISYNNDNENSLSVNFYFPADRSASAN